jgi:predicted DsbA family dithiol-disulfide isomerase
VKVEWRAFEIHPETPPEGRHYPESQRAQRAANFARIKDRARELGLEMEMLEVSPNSRRALEAAEHARVHGAHDPFHRAVFRRLFGEGRDIYQWEVLRQAAVEAGLDPDEMQKETEAGTYKAIVDTQLEKARERGLNVVPTFIFNGRHAIVGAQPYSTFEDIVRAEETSERVFSWLAQPYRVFEEVMRRLGTIRFT